MKASTCKVHVGLHNSVFNNNVGACTIMFILCPAPQSTFMAVNSGEMLQRVLMHTGGEIINLMKTGQQLVKEGFISLSSLYLILE